MTHVSARRLPLPALAALGALTLVGSCRGSAPGPSPEPEASATPTLADAPPMVANPDAPRDRIETRFRQDGEDKWIEWYTGYGPTGRQASLPINNPPVVDAALASHMKDDDPVIGVLVDGYARAYPWWIMTSGHLANDLIGGQPVLVTMCERCSGISAFRATLSGRMLDFRLAGVHHGTWFCADFQTGSFWHPFMGEAWRGPLKGRKLERLPTYETTWGQWRRDHPHTTVLLAGPEMRFRGHSRWPGLEPKHPGSPYMLDPAELQPHRPNPRKSWIPLREMVFGLRAAAPGHGKAYPLTRLLEVGLFQEEFDGKPIVLAALHQFQVGAYLRRDASGTLNLRLQSREPFRMRDQRGTVWDAWGQAVDGPGKGGMLQLLDGYVTEWYEWLYAAPETELLGHS